MTITGASGPDWASILTAVGTVAAAVAAVSIALWTDKRSAQRIATEHQRSDRLLEDERAYSRAQIDEAGFGDVRERLREGWNPSAEDALDGVLTPRDVGVRFESYLFPAQALENPYPLVRWTDQWGHPLGAPPRRSPPGAR